MISRFDIREELERVQSAMRQLDEKFIKTGDPTVWVLNFIEDVSGALSVIKNVYVRHADDRNKILKTVDGEVDRIKDACRIAKMSVRRSEQGMEPEDANKKADV